MATAKELLVHGQPTIDEIKKLFHDRKTSEAWKLIRDTPQPFEWVFEGQGVAGVFKYNPVGLIEELCYEVFGGYHREIVSSTITADKRGQFAATSTVIVHVRANGVPKTLHGIATVVVDNLPMLSLESPKSVTTAFKNAVAQLGSFFGRDLNRSLEDNLPVIRTQNTEEVDKITNLAFENLKKKLISTKWKETALQTLEASDFRFNVDLKNICNLKPSKS
jgi:hypothetical protein